MLVDTVAGKDTDEKINVTSEVNSNDLVFYDLSESGIYMQVLRSLPIFCDSLFISSITYHL